MICFKYIVVNTCIKVINNNKNNYSILCCLCAGTKATRPVTETAQVQKANTNTQSNEITYTRGNTKITPKNNSISDIIVEMKNFSKHREQCTRTGQ